MNCLQQSRARTNQLLFKFIGAPLAWSILLSHSVVAFAADRPNILFFLTDDVGWGDLKPYNPESLVSTPTIEQLAADGMLFTDAHSSAAKCAPSRYSIISGNYQWRGRNSWGQWNYKGGSQMLAGQQTLGHVMQQAGYETAFIGKYHLGGQFFLQNSNKFASGSASDSDIDFSRQFQDGSLALGFQYSFLALRGIQASPYAFFERDVLFGNPAALIPWLEGDYGDTKILDDGIGLPDWNTRQVGPVLLEKAVQFIDLHHSTNVARGTNQPFFLYYNTQAVHSPRKAPLYLRDIPILGSTGITDRTDMLWEIEVALSILLAELSSRDLVEDTLVIFTSDNGALRLNRELNSGHDALGGLRGAKGTIFEGGHRVPLIVKWGDGTTNGSRIAPGVVSNALVGVQDVYATLATLIGSVPGEDQGRDSFNILPILLGESSGPIRDHMIHEGDVAGGNHGSRSFAYREGDWKLLLNSDEHPEQLYNLANDRQESINLIGQSSQAARIVQMLSRFAFLRDAERTAPFSDAATVRVPDVSGLNQASSEETIRIAGLTIGTVSFAPSETIDAGNVISQSPSPGARVLAASVVDLVVSTGEPAGGITHCEGASITILGTAGDDDIRGTSGSDVIHGLAGNDTVRGLGGDDIICGGQGNDVIYGNAGNDTLFGQDGNDTLIGGGGIDLLSGGVGDDDLRGGGGNDQLFGDEGDDKLAGGNGNDHLDGGDDNDNCNGGGGNGDTAANCEKSKKIP